MIDEGKLNDEAAKAMRAQNLLDNGELKEAFDKLEDSYIAAWRSTKYDDHAAREKLFLAVNVVAKVKEHLQQMVADGKIAEVSLRNLYAESERKRRFGII
jgi:hypothetical protein